VCVKCGTAL